MEREPAIGKAPAQLTPEERAIDPRLRVIAFVGSNGESLASWASHSCHPATWPPAKWRPYHRDWPGVARDLVEQDVPFAMLNMGANGDVTALPVGQLRVERPLDRVQALGERIGQAWRSAHRRAREAARDVDLELGFYGSFQTSGNCHVGISGCRSCAERLKSILGRCGEHYVAT